jgi:hypothetical protein
MHISTDKQLDASFEQLRKRLLDPNILSPVHGASVFYFVYDPGMILSVRRMMPGWISRLKNEQGIEVETISLAGILWQLIDQSGRWNDWIELEKDFSIQQINDSVSSVLQQDNAFINTVVNRVLSVKSGKIVFITDVELIHPYAKTKPIESVLHNKSQIPVIFFYPGERTGQFGLKFLSFYPEDPGYRSSLIGGNE